MPRDQTQFRSQLPKWEVTDLGEGKLGIRCPRRGCRGKAVVNGKKWKETRTYNGIKIIGRSCTYCFRTAMIP